MKKNIALAAVVAALSCGQAFAQARYFEGLSLGVNAESERASVDATGGTSDSGTSTGLGLQVWYSWALGDSFGLGLGGTASTGNRKAGSYANTNEAYTKDRYSFDIVPSLAVSDKVMIFVKASSISANAASSSGTGTSSVQGLGYGLGLRAMIDSKLYWQAGYDSIRFNDVTFSNGTVATFKGNVIFLGVGYKF